MHLDDITQQARFQCILYCKHGVDIRYAQGEPLSQGRPALLAYTDAVPVIVKHGGKKYDVEVDLSSTGETFKYQLYSMTGVEPERQKIIVKGGQLKDEADMSKLGFKPKQQLMMMGTPAGGVNTFEKPKEAVKFLEDMTEAEAAQQEGAMPAGLQNLGNTCYMNSTLQTLRAIPELQTELLNYQTRSATTKKPPRFSFRHIYPFRLFFRTTNTSHSGSTSANGLGDLSQFGLSALGSSSDVAASLRDLYKQMGETQEGFPPLMFLNAFRGAYPQFAERTRDGRTYAQQDAEEAWSQIISSLRQKLKHEDGAAEGQSGASKESTFVDSYMGGKFEKFEEPTDPAAVSAGEKKRKLGDETFYKLNCHVSAREVIHLRDGITAALSDTYEKHSETLDKMAEYRTTSRISRLPRYLPIHFVRFYWKRDVQKKAKIMRKVTFPHELDVVEYCTDELREKLIPIRDKVRELRKEELDVERARKRQRRMAKAIEADGDRGGQGAGPAVEKAMNEDKNEMKKKDGALSDGKTKDGKIVEGEEKPEEVFKTDAEVEAEQEERILTAKKDLLGAVDAGLKADKTANQTGLYELRGVITHQGASADSGHYTAYVKKEARIRTDQKTGKKYNEPEDEGKWWWFNDEKVSEVDEEKISQLAGGGESHSALILLYRAVELPVLEEVGTADKMDESK